MEATMNTEKVRQLNNGRYDQILKAAAEIFNERGYQITTMRDIATSLNLTIGALYHYIQSKEDILFALCDRLMDHALKDLRENLKERTPGGEDEIKLIMKMILSNTMSHRDSVSVFLKEHRYLCPEKKAIIYKKRKEYETIVEQVIKNKIKNGELIDVDSKIITLSLFGMCNWVAYWYRPDGMQSIDYIAEMFSKIFTSGIYSPTRKRTVEEGRWDEILKLREENEKLKALLGEVGIILTKIESYTGIERNKSQAVRKR